MKALIVFDSLYGNTEKIARVIGDTLRTRMEVEILRVSEVKPAQLAGQDLLIAGSPTHGFQPSPATKEFLKVLPAWALTAKKVAAFDTRMPKGEIDSSVFFLKYLVKMFGFAAEKIDKRLQALGGSALVPPAGFYVHGREGPLYEGELERAVEWAKGILAKTA